MAQGIGRSMIGMLLQMYGQGMLGGQPKRMLDLQEQTLRAQAAASAAEQTEKARATATLDKPVWKKEPVYTEGDPEYDPAQGGSLPRQVKKPGQQGMTIRELQEFGKGVKDLPLGSMFTAGVRSEAMRPFMEKIFGPEVVGQMFAGGQPYMAKEEKAYEGMKRALGEQPEGAVTVPTLAHIERIFGAEEKPKTEPKPPTSILEYNEWKKDPKYVNKTYADYRRWLAAELAGAKAKAIFGDMTKEKRLALDMAKAALSESMSTLEMNDEQLLTQLMEFYHIALTKIHKAQPGKETPSIEDLSGGRVDPKFRRHLDVESIQKEIDRIKSER